VTPCNRPGLNAESARTGSSEILPAPSEMPTDFASPIQARRVAVTGFSVACALGLELDEFWRRLLAGECGIERLPEVPEDSPLPTKYAGHIPDGVLAAAVARRQIDDPDRANQLALYVAGGALDHAGLPSDGRDELEFDVIVGTGHGNVAFTNEASHIFHAHGFRKMRPTTVVRSMFNRPANLVSIRYRLTGTSHVVSCACASGSIAFGEAFNRIRFGLADGAVVVSCDSGIDPATFGAWNRLGVLSRNPDPTKASRPFDARRDGLVMGEGAAGFVLESFSSATRRGAPIMAEVLAYASTCDAWHIVQPDSHQQVKAIRRALASAGLQPEQIDYVNAHGTATEIADVVEAASLREAFGDQSRRVPVSNTKAQLGHLMGATAGVELVATILGLQHGIVPPCRNLDEPDPRCPLNFVRGAPLASNPRIALKNSFAFGGTNCAIILGRPQPGGGPGAGDR
jgi:3-oxoacyl-[acyl-carrier-protein] synthase II